MKGTETIKGLTQEEVEQRIQHHQVNVTEDSNRDQTKAIFKRNIFTYFNAIFIILSVLVIIVGSYRSLTFMPVVIANTIIGIIQQLRAMKIVNQLSILAESKYQVLRDGKITTVPISSLVLDDIVILEGGCQIPADAVIVQGNLSVNESLLTGEADEIEKEEGNELRSGSFAITGHCYAKLTHVGKDSYVSKLTTQAKEIKEHPSEMIHGIDWFIKVAGILIIPVGIGLFIQGMFVNHLGLQASVVSMVGAVIGMIPEGLYLLVTVALALSSARLAKKQVLLHDMRSTESLARADVLCVDKTGTITDNTMKVSDLIFPPEFDDPLIQSSTQAFESYVAAITDRNLTMDAIQEYVSPATPMEYIHLRPFHSKVKFSEIETDRAIYRFGAPDVLLDPEILTKYEDLLGEHMEKGRRILAFVRKGSEDFVPLLFVSIENGLRPGARDTFRYLVNQEVDIKVISGDNPLTVSRVAESAGIPESDCYVDAGTLSTREDYDDAVQKYVVFGRVKPEQKKELVQAIQRQGLKVAMTGDGVNDILAMKEADCSIAMGNGSDAARQAAQVVLLDSDFSRMKDIIGEGRRDINNITRSAILFLYKNLFSLFLGIFSIIRIFAYPLQPSQVSLISMFNIGDRKSVV